MKVLAISGSLRRDSHNTALLRAAAELLPPSVELELYEGLKQVEPYDEDDDVGAGPTGARRFREAIEAADAILIATPEYNSSIPGQLKNAVDWASRPKGENALWGKPVAVVGAWGCGRCSRCRAGFETYCDRPDLAPVPGGGCGLVVGGAAAA